jgi:hypothetical protein
MILTLSEIHELLDGVDVAVGDNGDEREALIEEILCGPQGIVTRVFHHLERRCSGSVTVETY